MSLFMAFASGVWFAVRLILLGVLHGASGVLTLLKVLL
jgi:hypothetical protein